MLVVDDEAVIADTLALILQSAGYRALPSYSAADAREAFQYFHPQLVLADIMLGDGNGLDLALEFRRSRPECKILLFSGAVTANELRRMAPEGCEFDFVSKPVAPRHMIELISNMFDPVQSASA